MGTDKQASRKADMQTETETKMRNSNMRKVRQRRDTQREGREMHRETETKTRERRGGGGGGEGGRTRERERERERGELITLQFKIISIAWKSPVIMRPRTEKPVIMVEFRTFRTFIALFCALEQTPCVQTWSPTPVRLALNIWVCKNLKQE